MNKPKRIRFIAAMLTVLMLLTLLPTAQISAAVEEARAQEEAFKSELAAYAEQYPEGAFAFYEAQSDLSEGDGDAAVQVVRLGDTSAQASVDLKAVDTTAFYGEDYSIYFKDGWTKIEPEKVVIEETAEEEQPTQAPAAESVDNEEVSALRSAYAQQTGEEPVNTNWRGEYEKYVAQVASIDAENEIINALEGWQLTLDFAPGEYVKTVYIHINDDSRSEGDEAAALILGNATVGMLGEQVEHTVGIKDNEPDEKIVFAMAQSEITVEPGSQYAEVTVKRVSGMDYYAGAVVRTAEGTAKPYEDYEPADGERISFAPGEKETVLQIPLIGEMKKGRGFTVYLDSDNVNVEDGKSSTVVWLGEKVESADGSVNEYGFPTLDVTPDEKAGKSDDLASTGAQQDIAATGWEDTYRSIKCDVTTYYPTDISAYTHAKSNLDTTARTYDKAITTNGAIYLKVNTKLSGWSKNGLIKYYNKNGTLEFNRASWGYHEVSDKKENETTYYTDTKGLSGSYYSDVKLSVIANTDGLCRDAKYEVTSYEVYRPRYTVQLIDANTNVKGRLYTSAANYTEFNVGAVKTSPSWSSKTLSYNSSDGNGGRINVHPGTLQDGVVVDHYEVYVGNRYITNLSGTDTMTYEWIGNNVSKRYSGDLYNTNFTVKVKPVYTVTSSSVVNFKSEDKNIMWYSGFNDTLVCRPIDKLQLTIKNPSGRDFYSTGVTIIRNKIAYDNTYNNENNKEYTVTIPVNVGYLELMTYYRKPTLTVRYHPDEVTSPNAGLGAVGLSTLNDPDNTLGYTDFENPFIMPTALLPYGLEGMNKTYLARTIPGEGFGDHESTTDTGLTFRSTTKTIWSYKDNNGQDVSVYGNSFVFSPFYTDSVYNYHFKEVQVDEKMVGASGKVQTEETPLFSLSKTKIKKDAVGVQMNVGGYNVTTDTEGKYSVPANFNKAEVVGAYLKYDTIALADQICMSTNTVKDFVLNVNSEDGIVISYDDTKMTKDKPRLDDKGKPQKDFDGNIIYDEVAADGITKEDMTYHMYIAATGNSGAVIPTKAEIKVYSRKGTLRQDMTKTVNFVLKDGVYVAELQFNPSADGLNVGDSFTVKCYDQNNVGYYEHQTDKTKIIAEKLSGLYMFNYNGIKKEGSSNLIKLLGGLSIGYDTALDLLTNEYGEYYDKDGDKQMHDMFAIGATVKYKPGKGSGSFQFTSAEEAYKKMKELKTNFSKLQDGSYEPNLPKREESVSTFGTDGNAFDIALSVCVIMDSVLETDDPNHLGEYKFGDFFIYGNATLNYSKRWTVPVGPVVLTFDLAFKLNQDNNKAAPGIKWHFYSDSDSAFYISSNSTIDLLASKKLENEGDISFNAVVSGSVAAEVLDGLVGVRGGLTVGLSHTAYYNDGWVNKGVVSLKPNVDIKVLIAWINVWRQEWVYNYDNGKSVSPTGEAMEEILFTSTKNRKLADLAATGSGNTLPLNDNETLLSDISADQTGIKVQDLGNGKYLAVWLDNVPGRDEANALGAYYAIYNGSAWSAPVLLEDDGTIDQMPTICKAGSKGFLIAWSDASRKLEADENLTDSLNTLNLTGRFFNPDTETLGAVMELTKSTEQDDETADTDPSIVYYTENGQEYMKMYYTKSEFSVSDETEGEVVGDLLNPYQVIAVRNYDFENDCWREDYVGNAKKNLLDQIGADNYDAYVADWYGQEFLDLAPDVTVNETLDDYGYWQDGTTAEITESDNSQTVAKNGASFAYNHLSLYAYALDKGGMSQDTGDQNLYLQIYNFKEDTYHHPICISAQSGEISDIQFVRMPVPNGEGGSTEMTYLYWLDNGVVKKLNISTLVANNLVKATTSAGQSCYYIDKTRSDADTCYEPEIAITSGYNGSEDDDVNGVSNFKTYQKGAYNYTVWTQFVPKEDDEGKINELQLFALRENTLNGEASAAVQLTDTENLYVNSFDCVVCENGDLDITAECMALNAEGAPDYSTGVIKTIHIVPNDRLVINAAEESDETYTEDGAPAIEIDVEIKNEGLNTANNVVAELRDKSGTVISTTDSTEHNIELEGGYNTYKKLILPVAKDGSYSATLVLRKGDTEIATQALSGQITAAYEASALNAVVTERNHVYLTGTVKNTSVLDGSEQNAVYGFTDKNGNKLALGTVPMGALKAGESFDINVEATVDFSKFAETTDEDGNVIASAEFYLSTDAEDTVEATVTVELTATAEEAALMNDLSGKTLSAQPGKFNDDCGIDLTGAMTVGDTSTLRLTVDGEAAYNMPEYVNRTKIIWTESDDEVASVSADGFVTAKCKGTTTVRGLLMPCDTETILYENGFSENVDRYLSLPSSLVIPIEATITVNDKLLGDVDGDGKVTIIDATFIQRWLASIPIPFEFNEAIADSDGDGNVSIIDATYIQRWLVNLPSNDDIGKPIK